MLTKVTDFMGKSFGENEVVKIDVAHGLYVLGLVTASKPKTILELGIGSGYTTDLIIKAASINQNNPKIDVVDNWSDFNFQAPIDAIQKYSKLVNLINMSELEYVFSTENRYDFIFSDADHNNTDKWFSYVFQNLLNPGGYLMYHDVTNASFPNLKNILALCHMSKLNYRLFYKNSNNSERCDRGLLCIHKDEVVAK
jgi:predicted O-methyltransferase YrrM